MLKKRWCASRGHTAVHLSSRCLCKWQTNECVHECVHIILPDRIFFDVVVHKYFTSTAHEIELSNNAKEKSTQRVNFISKEAMLFSNLFCLKIEKIHKLRTIKQAYKNCCSSTIFFKPVWSHIIWLRLHRT